MAKKKTVSEKFGLQDTSLFKKNKREEQDINDVKQKKRKKKAKIVMTVFVLVIILTIVVPWLVVTFKGDPDYKRNTDSVIGFEQRLEATTATAASTELHSMKNPDITDINAIRKLIDYLGPEYELGKFELSVKNDSKPYQITLSFAGTHDVPEDGSADVWHNRMVQYSVAILALIDNIQKVSWNFPLGSTVGGASFERADAQELLNLGVSPQKFAESPQSVQLLLNELGIEIY